MISLFSICCGVLIYLNVLTTRWIFLSRFFFLLQFASKLWMCRRHTISRALNVVVRWKSTGVRYYTRLVLLLSFTQLPVLLWVRAGWVWNVCFDFKGCSRGAQAKQRVCVCVHMCVFVSTCVCLLVSNGRVQPSQITLTRLCFCFQFLINGKKLGQLVFQPAEQQHESSIETQIQHASSFSADFLWLFVSITSLF